MTSPQTGLVRAIGRWSLAALAVNSIIGSGIFGLPATVAGLLGKRSVVAVLIAGAAMGVIMACFAEVASQFSEAGGPYLYARAAFGRLTGILVGWMLYLAQTAAPAANANLFVIYLAEFWPAGEGTLAALCDPDVTGGTAGAHQHSRRTAGDGGKQRVHGSETFAAADGGVGGSCDDDHPSGAVGRGGGDAGKRVDEGDGSADLRLRWI